MAMGILGDKGQIQTVEAITAAIIMLSVLVLVIQATSVTPLTASFTNQHIKLELQNIGTDLLTTLDETPSANNYDPNTYSMLKMSVLNWMNFYHYDYFAWSNDADKYKSLTDYTNPQLDTPLGEYLSYLLKYYGIAYNVEVRYSYVDALGQVNVKNAKMIWNGDPSENSVTVSRIVVLHDLDSSDMSVIPDFSPTTSLYNVVEVKLTLWVM
jgi:hypothetical protein